VIAPSYADIFFNNCFKNGILPIVQDAEIVDRLFNEMYASDGYQLSVDLQAQTITTPSNEVLGFEVEGFRKNCLLNGLDDIAITLQQGDAIRVYEAQRRQQAPWLFASRL
jgi:3-isopropylmalate/(R)-2-methylmalate dehydratase small subunit